MSRPIREVAAGTAFSLVLGVAITESAMPTADEAWATLAASRFLLAHRIVAPFLEAYAVLADRLAAADPVAAVAEDALIAECVGVAQQRVLQRQIHSPESVSRPEPPARHSRPAAASAAS